MNVAWLGTPACTQTEVFLSYSQLTPSAVHPHTLCTPQTSPPFLSDASPAASKAPHAHLSDKTRQQWSWHQPRRDANQPCFLHSRCVNPRLFAPERRGGGGGMQGHDLSEAEDQSRRERPPTWADSSDGFELHCGRQTFSCVFITVITAPPYRCFNPLYIVCC